jgi:hypothetical protein
MSDKPSYAELLRDQITDMAKYSAAGVAGATTGQVSERELIATLAQYVDWLAAKVVVLAGMLEANSRALQDVGAPTLQQHLETIFERLDHPEGR